MLRKFNSIAMLLLVAVIIIANAGPAAGLGAGGVIMRWCPPGFLSCLMVLVVHLDRAALRHGNQGEDQMILRSVSNLSPWG